MIIHKAIATVQIPTESRFSASEFKGIINHSIQYKREAHLFFLSFSFSRSERGLYLYAADSLSTGAIDTAMVDVSPSTLIPFYDPDTSVVILTGKVRNLRIKVTIEPKLRGQ